ncbi:MAG: rhodanese-like domain-containing protein [Robiginitomaculum sp.]|nr:rhodanese-like domain-containing protein [Robiginitomaculum sp.]
MKLTHVDIHEAHKQLTSNPEIMILDLRTEEEFELFYIEGAVNVDATEKYFAFEIGELDKDKTYLIHCHSGDRSLKALDEFKKQGFKHIIHMDSGMREWNHNKLPAIYNWTI